MEEIKAPKKERKFLKAVGNIAKVLANELVMGIARKFIGKAIDKVGNKRQGLVLAFIILASTFAIAQFPNTGNKQRLGFQTTGDGLVWRGSLSDTASIQPINNQNAWVILDTVNLKMYSFDFTSNVWNLISGAGGGLTMPFDSITFNTAKDGTVGVGEVEYNDTQGSLIQGLKGGLVTNVIGQQLHQRVNNRTGATLSKGMAVYLSGSQGNRITVAKALAISDPTSANTFGIVAESILDNQSGYVITEGLLINVNTSSLVEDSAVYLSPTVAGALTSTKPQAPQHSVYIGVCVKSNNGSGELFVKIRNGQELDELHDVQITSPVDRASLYYKSSEKLWRDTTAALLVSDTASMLLPYLRDADTVTLSNRINLKLNIADTSAFARDNQISGTSGQVAYFNSSNSVISDAGLIYNATNKSLGINTTTTSGANLIIKNSQEPSRATVVTTQTFAADTTNWTRGSGWTFNGTQAVATAATGNLTYTPALTITSENAYEITYTIASYSAGTLTAAIGNITYALPTHNATANVVVLLPTSATGGFRFTTSTFTGTLDNVSVVQISNPASILFAGQDDGSANIYSSLQMPNSTTIGFGGNAGRFTTGISNNFFGSNSGRYNTTGFYNNFFGASAGENNTTGFYNNFFGFQSGLFNTTGFSNNFFGLLSGQNNTTGTSNNFFGENAGRFNTTGFNNNFFGNNAGNSNTTGNENNFFGAGAGQNNKTGGQNVFIGLRAGRDNISGNNNVAIGRFSSTAIINGTANTSIGDISLGNNIDGTGNVAVGESALSNTKTGLYNTGVGSSSLVANYRGSYNLGLGYRALFSSVVADSLTGSNNIAIGRNVADNIRAAADGNVAIGNQVDLPTNNGSNQGVYQNVLFFTGASGTGTTIAAASKAGIKTNAPNRDLEVAGEVRITDLTTDAPTRLVGADDDGDLGQVTLGAGLSLASSSLLADTNFLVTRFDTASMLTPYFRDADTTSLNLTSRFAAKLNISDTASMLTNYFRTGTAASTYQAKLNGSGFVKATGTTISYDNSTYLTTGTAASTYLPLTGGTLSGSILNGWTAAYSSAPRNDGAVRRTYTENLRSVNGGNTDRVIHYYTFSKDECCDANRAAPVTMYYGRLNGFYDGWYPSNNTNIIYDASIYYHGTNQFYYRAFSESENKVTFSIKPSNTVNSITGTKADLYLSGDAQIDRSLNIGTTLGVTGATTLSAPLTVNSSAVFNEGSADSDFRVESDGNANMVFVDASTDRVGIGYASPTKTLDVNGTLGVFGATNLSNTLTVDGKTILNDSARFEGNILFKKNMSLPIVKISNADYTATTFNHTIIYTTLTADKTLTIPNASDAVGVKFVISIFDIPEGNEALTLVTPASNLFVRTDGENSSVDIVGGYCTTIQSDGIKWYILSYAPMY